MKKKKITIDSLAGMIQRGFGEMAKKAEVDQQFNSVNDRLDRIEKLLIDDHNRRIEKLESAVKELKDLLAVK
ncbi:MAG: hypothetical protein UV67_C0001G0015 [Parcubacteria group bacterium GW2011_GWC1_43_12]|nr:MAG: hypothetical protein UV34_C0012G0016 [Parcubacteria group bacterium GW2011_GWB1_42_6]KKS92575.1 MAG: hypothetical protein UV67_C0001G0015 [Parcubacteria group bacterium GW2011_GWC1_43_12]